MTKANIQWHRNEFESGGGALSGAMCRNFFVGPLHYFGSKSTVSRFGENYCDSQYSLVSFLFAVLLLTVPLCVQPFVKVGCGTCPVPYGVGATTNANFPASLQLPVQRKIREKEVAGSSLTHCTVKYSPWQTVPSHNCRFLDRKNSPTFSGKFPASKYRK